MRLVVGFEAVLAFLGDAMGAITETEARGQGIRQSRVKQGGKFG
jgi:hypothetical protein